MADQMTRQEFAEYMSAFEQRLDMRFGRIDGQLGGIDGRLDVVDQRLDGIDRRFDVVDQQLDGIDRRLDVVDQRLDQHDRRFAVLENSLTDLKQSMTVQFEETRREIKLSLEAVVTVREVTEDRFDRMSRDQAVNTAVLQAAIRDVQSQVQDGKNA